MAVREKILITMTEKKRLDRLFGAALIDDGIFERLVHERDPGLFDDFLLSEPVRGLLKAVVEPSLAELARTINERARW